MSPLSRDLQKIAIRRFQGEKSRSLKVYASETHEHL